MFKKRIALVQPYIPAGKSLGIEKAPESIQALAGQLEREGHSVQMFHEQAGEELDHKLAEFDPDYVGISTMTANFPEGKKVAKAVKGRNPQTPVILGGWHASGVVQAYLRGQESETIEEILNSDSPIDFLVAGEGDLVLPEIVRRLSSGEDARQLNGVGYLSDGEINVTVADRVKNLDDLTDPSWTGLPVDKYRDKRTGSLDLSVHFNRACRFACGFCSTATVYGKGVRTFGAERAVDYVESLLEEFSPEVITFTDEDFFANPRWVAEVVRLFGERDLHGKYGVEFDTFASINDIHRLEQRGEREFLERMKQAGFNSFTVGVESLNPQVLRKYNKELMILPTMTREQKDAYKQGPPEEQDRMLVGHYLACTQRAINFAHQHGILVVGDYIFGNLGETEEQVREGFEMFSGLQNLHVAYLPIFTPFPGTGLWKEAYDSGRLARTPEGNIDWARFDASAGALDLGYDIEGLRNQFELEFYTSERFRRDMHDEIKRTPEKVGMFKARLNYLNGLFPGNELVEERLRELE